MSTDRSDSTRLRAVWQGEAEEAGDREWDEFGLEAATGMPIPSEVLWATADAAVRVVLEHLNAEIEALSLSPEVHTRSLWAVQQMIKRIAEFVQRQEGEYESS